MFRIFAYISPRTLGDFVAYAQLASSIRDLFDDSKLYVYYRNDRPYKEPIMRCIRNASAVITLPPENPGIPIDYFDAHHGRPTHNIPFWEKNELHNTDLILSGKMMNELMLNTMPIHPLCPPEDSVAESNKALIALGLDPERWFACVYWKEDGYQFRGKNHIRTISDPAPYIAAIRHIIEDLGGQVVRLGHPTPTALPKLKGLVDLANVAGSEWLQLYAVSRARFYIASSSGPAAYGSAFGVPTVNTDQNLCLGAWGPKDYVVTQGIEINGQILRQLDAFNAGCLVVEFNNAKARYHRNTVAELLSATQEMFSITTDCQKWREYATYVPPSKKPNALTFPIERRLRPDLLIPPSQR